MLWKLPNWHSIAQNTDDNMQSHTNLVGNMLSRYRAKA